MQNLTELLRKAKKNPYIWLVSFVMALLSFISIFWVERGNIEKICFFRDKEIELKEVFLGFPQANVYREEDSPGLLVSLSFSERASYDVGEQIFSDINRQTKIKNAARRLVEEIGIINRSNFSVDVRAAFKGGADSFGGQLEFSKRLSLGEIVISATEPTINGIPYSDVYVFKDGQALNNTRLALVRAAYAAHLFLTEFESLGSPVPMDASFVATTYEVEGVEYRYGRIDVQISSELTNIPLLPEFVPLDKLCDSFFFHSSQA
ncbi:MAG: hypothetical protein AAGH17_00450 [Pseudomonadota bacterium]